jgi:2-oxoglutarate ferredoxin oxidoreductase subunit delta
MTPKKKGGKPGPHTSAPEAQPVQEASPHKEFEHDIYRAWCKQCGLCAAFCPRGVIELDDTGAPVIAHPERCIGCGWCEVHCPDFAISVRERQDKKETREGAD